MRPLILGNNLSQQQSNNSPAVKGGGYNLVLADTLFLFWLFITIVRFTLNSSTRIMEFSTNIHEISYTQFSIHVVTTLKISQSFDQYFSN